MGLVRLLSLKQHGDTRGSLVSLEFNKNIPLDVKRTYFIYNIKPGEPRGFHAHKKLKQLAFCITGSCRFILSDGLSTEEYLLDTPTIGLWIDQMIWHEMHDMSENCVLLILADDYYEENDYIRSKDEFMRRVNGDELQNTSTI